jgi:hypothetical protein
VQQSRQSKRPGSEHYALRQNYETQQSQTGVALSSYRRPPGLAQVKLPIVNLGDTNFEDGFGAPGWFLEEFPSGYSAGELKDSKGKTAPGSSRVTAYSTTSHVAFVSKKRFLGGGLAGEVLLPLVDLDVRLASGTDSRVRGFADLAVGAGLQWARLV